jgi:hypothetical protein
MESDADRLASIKSLGGQIVRHADGEFWAIFESPYHESAFSDGPSVETRQPMLTAARTCDVDVLSKDTVLHVAGMQYLFKRHEPDGTGMSTVFLRL